LKSIKNIHSFGTSFTDGGGFEFDSPQKDGELLKSIYESTGENLTKYNFSWPGQLEKLLPKNIKVFNHAKSGFGNERMYRIAEQIISDDDFKKDENLFIFESSWIGRKEYFLNSINDYVIFNYNFKKTKGLPQVGYNYFYDDKETQIKLDKFKKIVLPFFDETFNEKTVETEIFRNARFFLSFLKQKKINYLFIDSFLPEIKDKNKINFKVGNETYEDLGQLIFSSKYSIENETLGKLDDKHLGYFGNKLVASTIYNTLVDKKYIEGNKVKFKKYNRINQNFI